MPWQHQSRQRATPTPGSSRVLRAKRPANSSPDSSQPASKYAKISARRGSVQPNEHGLAVKEDDQKWNDGELSEGEEANGWEGYDGVGSLTREEEEELGNKAMAMLEANQETPRNVRPIITQGTTPHESGGARRGSLSGGQEPPVGEREQSTATQHNQNPHSSSRNPGDALESRQLGEASSSSNRRGGVSLKELRSAFPTPHPLRRMRTWAGGTEKLSLSKPRKSSAEFPCYPELSRPGRRGGILDVEEEPRYRAPRAILPQDIPLPSIEEGLGKTTEEEKGGDDGGDGTVPERAGHARVRASRRQHQSTGAVKAAGRSVQPKSAPTRVSARLHQASRSVIVKSEPSTNSNSDGSRRSVPAAKEAAPAAPRRANTKRANTRRAPSKRSGVDKGKARAR
ncbi:hypothetical protein EMCG_05343 [[Emmonsia] crescens]|uniref:Uncharacterized protein n=1 Tax=[Emmonsia] crescens TaxID=73230 RepID=A0A0G2IXM2_9EURO|nr:hypothetical protein EMCG_05343 [Emmonsia crescens UAMH 3008]